MSYPQRSIDLHKLVSGDKKAWDDFVTAYTPVIYSAASKVLLAHDPAAGKPEPEEIVQEIFLKLISEDYQLLKSFDARKASMVTWLTVITRNATVDALRKKKLETVTVDGELPEGVAETGDPETVAVAAIPQGLLTGRQQLVLHLNFDRALEVNVIARILGIDEQTVRSTRHKAMERLRKHYSKK